jgi:hypothetical protein
MLAGWRKQWTADGIVLLPPSTEEPGVIRIRERQQPLCSFRAIIDEINDRAGEDFKRHLSYGPLTLFPTAEGEHAGLISLSSRAPTGQSVERTVAMIVGDTCYGVVDSMTSDARRFDEFRELVHTLAKQHCMGLGQLRSRRYYYEPPADWQGIARPRSVRWFHPRYPHHPGMIEVHDTRLQLRSTVDAVDRMLTVDPVFLAERDQPRPLERVKTPTNLVGYLRHMSGTTATGQHLTVLFTMLSDDRFQYITTLETTTDTLDECLPAYRRVVATIDPVPRAKLAFDSDAAAFIHWVE